MQIYGKQLFNFDLLSIFTTNHIIILWELRSKIVGLINLDVNKRYYWLFYIWAMVLSQFLANETKLISSLRYCLIIQNEKWPLSSAQLNEKYSSTNSSNCWMDCFPNIPFKWAGWSLINPVNWTLVPVFKRDDIFLKSKWLNDNSSAYKPSIWCGPTEIGLFQYSSRAFRIKSPIVQPLNFCVRSADDDRLWHIGINTRPQSCQTKTFHIEDRCYWERIKCFVYPPRSTCLTCLITLTVDYAQLSLEENDQVDPRERCT